MVKNQWGRWRNNRDIGTAPQSARNSIATQGFIGVCEGLNRTRSYTYQTVRNSLVPLDRRGTDESLGRVARAAQLRLAANSTTTTTAMRDGPLVPQPDLVTSNRGETEVTEVTEVVKEEENRVWGREGMELGTGNCDLGSGYDDERGWIRIWGQTNYIDGKWTPAGELLLANKGRGGWGRTWMWGEKRTSVELWTRGREGPCDLGGGAWRDWGRGQEMAIRIPWDGQHRRPGGRGTSRWWGKMERKGGEGGRGGEKKGRTGGGKWDSRRDIWCVFSEKLPETVQYSATTNMQTSTYRYYILWIFLYGENYRGRWETVLIAFLADWGFFSDEILNQDFILYES